MTYPIIFFNKSVETYAGSGPPSVEADFSHKLVFQGALTF